MGHMRRVGSGYQSWSKLDGKREFGAFANILCVLTRATASVQKVEVVAHTSTCLDWKGNESVLSAMQTLDRP